LFASRDIVNPGATVAGRVKKGYSPTFCAHPGSPSSGAVTSKERIRLQIAELIPTRQPFFSLEFFPPKERDTWPKFFAEVEKLKAVHAATHPASRLLRSGAPAAKPSADELLEALESEVQEEG